MTNSNTIQKFLSTMFLCLGQLFLLSCSQDDGDPIPPITPEDPTNQSSIEVTTLVESMGANDALEIDNDGNIYASEFGGWSSTGGSGSKILKVTPAGVVTTFASGLSGPLDIVIAENGNFYVVNDNNGTNGDIVQIMPDGTLDELATVPGWPAGITSDEEGNLFISNYQRPTLHKLATDGTLTELANDSNLAGCVGITIDENGELYTANYNTGKVYKVSEAGNVSLIASIPGVVSNFAIGYMDHFDGSLYATGIGSHKIYKIDLDGSSTVFAGSGSDDHTDGPVLNAAFKNPNGIVIDKSSKVMYVLDWGKPSLRKIELE
ncbi:MAG: hypothetical protein ABJG78_03265 [Cyclobacteriaceae bacterium]